MHDPSRVFDLPPGALEALGRGNKIEAIRITRQTQKIDLKEAKARVDAYVDSQPALQRRLEAAQAEARKNLWIYLLIAAALLALGYAWLNGR